VGARIAARHTAAFSASDRFVERFGRPPAIRSA